MRYQKGHGPTGGRKKGVPNKLTKTVKETVLAVFNDLQADPKANLLSWAKNNPKDFYLIASKLIPTEIKGIGSGAIKVIFEEGDGNRSKD